MSYENVNVAGTMLEVPAALAAALVEAQSAVGAVTMNGRNDQIRKDYATSDDICAAAKLALNAAGAAFVRLGTSVSPPGLADYELGNQGYAGDVEERWMIVHKDGAAIVGTTTMPVIVSKGRPHEKAVSASLTYGAGVTLRGVLCIEREDKNAVDRREDKRSDDRINRRGGQPQRRQQGPEQPPQRPRCTGKGKPIADANWARCNELAELYGQPPGHVWETACAKLGFMDPKGKAAELGQLYIEDGRKAGELLKMWIATERAKAPTP